MANVINLPVAVGGGGGGEMVAGQVTVTEFAQSYITIPELEGYENFIISYNGTENLTTRDILSVLYFKDFPKPGAMMMTPAYKPNDITVSRNGAVITITSTGGLNQKFAQNKTYSFIGWNNPEKAELPDNATLDVTGAGDASKCYVTINGTKIYSAQSEIVLTRGQTIVFSATAQYDYSAYIYVDGVEVARATSLQTATYTLSVPDNIIRCNIQLTLGSRTTRIDFTSTSWVVVDE